MKVLLVLLMLAGCSGEIETITFPELLQHNDCFRYTRDEVYINETQECIDLMCEIDDSYCEELI